MIKHDYDLAHSKLASSEAASYSTETLRARWELLERNEGPGTLTDLKAYVATGDESNSHARARLTTRKGSKYDISIDLSKINGDWKIVQARPDLIP